MSHFTFGSIKSSDKHIRTLTEIVRSMQAGSRDDLAEITGMNGSHYFGADLTEATIRVRGYSKASSMSNRIKIIRNLQKWLVGAELQQLTFSDEEDKFYMAKLTGDATPSIIGLLMFWDLNFLVPDGCAYSVTPKTVTFPLEDPAEEEKAVNAGSLPCPCVITSNLPDIGAASSLVVGLGETYYTMKEHIRLDRSVYGGDEIFIDTGQRFISCNGVDARADVTLQSNYFMLPPGEFSLTTLPFDIPLTVTFRERWG